MSRRPVIKGAAALALPAMSRWGTPARAEATPGAPFRRARPSDPAWPAPASWDRLQQRVGGRLFRVRSPLVACNEPTSAACAELFRDLRNPYYIGDTPGLTETSGWVDAWTSQPSTYAVAAKTAADVAAAVDFARENRLRLVVKGGGHSYQGTSNAADSLLIWTRQMRGIVVHDAFVPQGCGAAVPPQPAVTVEPGAIWMHVYGAVTTQAGRYVQGGGCATVGVAGLVQSGGFGSFSKNFGTGAGGLLEAEVVTADGAIRIANSCQNPDLFWGLKGGGGGSLGVVTRLTLKTHELPPVFGIALATVRARSDSAFRALIGRFLDFYAARLLNPHWGEQFGVRSDNTLTVAMVFQGLDQRQAEAVWQPFFDAVAGSQGEYLFTEPPRVLAMPARHWWDGEWFRVHAPAFVVADWRPGASRDDVWFAGDSGQVGFFLHGYESMWLPAALLRAGQQARLADALFAASRHWSVQLHCNKGLAGAPEAARTAARDTATNPAVLDAFALAIIAGGEPPAFPGIPGHEPDLKLARGDAARIGQAARELSKVAPDAGSYVSESNFFEANWQRAFWGDNYPRLRAVKAAYDPDGLFFVHHGVGSEEWSPDGFTRLR